MTEYQDQEALFEYLEWQSNIEPDLQWAYAVPNGQYRPGQRMEPGLKSGVPDVVIPIARGGYFSLYIEMKHGNNKASDNQKEWIAGLIGLGHCVHIANGFDEAKEIVEWYMALAPTMIDLPV